MHRRRLAIPGAGHFQVASLPLLIDPRPVREFVSPSPKLGLDFATAQQWSAIVFDLPGNAATRLNLTCHSECVIKFVVAIRDQTTLL